MGSTPEEGGATSGSARRRGTPRRSRHRTGQRRV